MEASAAQTAVRSPPDATSRVEIPQYPTKRYRSAWIEIAVHSAQSVVIIIVILTLVI
jgi:hypothetical protein